MIPLDGEAFFTSQIKDIPGRRSARSKAGTASICSSRSTASAIRLISAGGIRFACSRILSLVLSVIVSNIFIFCSP